MNRRVKNLQWRKTRTSGDYVETDRGCGGDFVEVGSWCCGRIMWRSGRSGWELVADDRIMERDGGVGCISSQLELTTLGTEIPRISV